MKTFLFLVFSFFLGFLTKSLIFTHEPSESRFDKFKTRTDDTYDECDQEALQAEIADLKSALANQQEKKEITPPKQAYEQDPDPSPIPDSNPVEKQTENSEEENPPPRRDSIETGHLPEEKLLKVSEQFIAHDPPLFYARAKPLTDYNQAKRFNGQFRGHIYHVSGAHKGRTDDIELSINFRINKSNKVTGEYYSILSHNGDVHSRKNSNGENQSIRENGEFFILDLRPDTFLQLQKTNLKIGNYYHNGKFIGIVRLRRE